MRNYKDNIIVKLTFQFALDIMSFSEKLRDQRRFAFADQLLRSGCSVGANVKEAQSAESKADFIHKLKIASKEAEETEYWLELCQFNENYPKPGKLLTDVESILKVLAKIVTTSRKGKGSLIEN
jgi:four helix bundle protein